MYVYTIYYIQNVNNNLNKRITFKKTIHMTWCLGERIVIPVLVNVLNDQ